MKTEMHKFKVIIHDEGTNYEEHHYYIDDVYVDCLRTDEGDIPESGTTLFEAIAEFLGIPMEVENVVSPKEGS